MSLIKTRHLSSSSTLTLIRLLHINITEVGLETRFSTTPPFHAQTDLQMKTSRIKRLLPASLHQLAFDRRTCGYNILLSFFSRPTLHLIGCLPKCWLCKLATWFAMQLSSSAAPIPGFHFHHKLYKTVQWLNMSFLKSLLLILIRRWLASSKHCLWTEIHTPTFFPSSQSTEAQLVSTSSPHYIVI